MDLSLIYTHNTKTCISSHIEFSIMKKAYIYNFIFDSTKLVHILKIIGNNL